MGSTSNLSLPLSKLFYKAFRKIRDNFTNEPVIYPDIYYETVYKTIEELAILKEKRNYLLEYRTSGGIWLIGELRGKEISEKTYTWLWRNLLLALHYQQDDLIVNHWEICHQYYSYSLPYIYSNYGNSSDFIQINEQEAVNKSNAKRQRFIEFHYALGGLLTYKKRYKCIERLFNHTLSQPPRYELLPESMNEIFNFYRDIRDPFDIKYTFISNQYPFPELSGLNADHIIKEWIMSYMAILFLRQYTITPYFITTRPLDLPTIPSTQIEIRQWIEGIDIFEKLVSDHLQNKELLITLNLDFITPKWCEDNQKPYPVTLINTLKSKLESAYHTNSMTLQISNKKVLLFETATKKILESAIENLHQISNSIPVQDEGSDKWYVYNQKLVQDKDAFSENPEVDHGEFDSFLATNISRNLNQCLEEALKYKTSQSYLLNLEDFFKAIDILSIDESFIIINFGINLDYFIKQLKMAGLSENKYKNVNIYSVKGIQTAENSLFVLKKSDLPTISTIPINSDIIKKYSLKKISEVINLFSSIIDLNNTTEEIFNEYKYSKSDDEMRKSVLTIIVLSVEFKWKKNIEVVQLRQYSEFYNRGILNKLEDVEPMQKIN